jgi:Mrp family chromosome partitioning ATPase
MSSPQALEPTLLHAVRRYWALAVVTFIVIAAGAVGVLTLTATSNQTAEMSMLLENPRESALFNGGQAQARGTADYLADQQDILDTAEIARRSVVAARERDPGFPYDTVEFLARRTVVRPSGQALVTVRFVADTTEHAVLGANSFAVAYREFLESESAAEYTEYIAALDGEIEELQDRIADAQRRIDAADSDGELTVLNQQVSALIRRASATAERRDQLEVDADLLSGGGVRLVTPAVVSQGSATGGMRSLLAVGFIAALGALGVTYLYALRRRTFTSATEAGLALDAPVLGIVPEYDADELLDLDADRDHRFVVDIVGRWQDRHGADEPVVIAVTAAGRGAGVTTSVAAMASVLGWRRKDTTVIDGDVNEQQLTRTLQPESTLDHAGLSDVIDGEHGVADVTRPVGTDLPAVSLISRGSRQLAPADHGSLPSVIAEIAASHQVTLIDVPGGVADTLHRAILSAVDHLLVVVPHGSRVIAVERLRDTLAALGLGCDGVVVNRVPARGRPRRPGRREATPRDVRAPHGDRERSDTPGADIFESTEP